MIYQKIALMMGNVHQTGIFWRVPWQQSPQETTGKLYSLSPDGSLKTLLVDLQISNGLAWSPDYKTFYFIDTPTSAPQEPVSYPEGDGV